jgi:hypothetical protein
MKENKEKSRGTALQREAAKNGSMAEGDRGPFLSRSERRERGVESLEPGVEVSRPAAWLTLQWERRASGARKRGRQVRSHCAACVVEGLEPEDTPMALVRMCSTHGARGVWDVRLTGDPGADLSVGSMVASGVMCAEGAAPEGHSEAFANEDWKRNVLL